MINGFYLDESGNTGFGDIAQQPVVCYGGIMVPNSSVIEIEREFEALSYKSALQIKSEIKGLTHKHINTMPFFRDYEIHSKAFFDGDDLYSKIPVIDRFSIAEEMLSLIARFNCKVFATVIDKTSYQRNTGETHHANMHQLAMGNLMRLIENELNEKNETGIIIPDRGRAEERELLVQVIRQQTTTNRIFNSSFLQDSHHCQLVQLADLVVFLTTIFYRSYYGYVARKVNNQELIELYQNIISPLDPIIWEYPFLK